MKSYIKKTNAMSPVSVENLTPQISPEAFKALFYLYAGRPDCTLKVFEGQKTITPHDLQNLNSKIIEKLKLHTLEASITAINIKFENGKMIDFSIWDTFSNTDWQSDFRTEQIEMKWDFLLRTDSVELPQRHTLVVKLSNGLDPKDFFRLMATLWEDDTEIDIKAALCVARVDFISHLLADELIAIVNGWYKCLPEATVCESKLAVLRKYDNKIAMVIHYSLPIIFWIALFAFTYKTIPMTEVPLNQHVFSLGVFMLFFCFIGTFFFYRLGHMIATSCYSAINTTCRFSMFNLTAGDKKFLSRCERKNKKVFRKFIFNVILALLLNIIGSIIAGYFFAI